MARSDGPGLVRLAAQLPLLFGSGAATVWLAAQGHPAWMAAVTLCGVMIVTLFPPLHEAGHRTAFRTGFLNEAMAWFGALAMLQAPSFFREFHWAHHRHTQDLKLDPELSGAPKLLGGLPRSPWNYLFRVSGQALLLGKAGFTVGCAVLPGSLLWTQLFPFIRPNLRARIVWESRAAVLILGGLCFAGLRYVPGFAQLLLAWPIAHLALGFYLLFEHAGLPEDGSQLHRTRTIRSIPLVRFFMWNMTYHAEHHAYPAVAFHALPQLHQRLTPELEHVVPGFLSFHWLALRHAFTFGRAGADGPAVASMPTE
jgi:fatty acid desaturase